MVGSLATEIGVSYSIFSCPMLDVKVTNSIQLRPKTLTVIEPNQGLTHYRIAELWKYRDLLYYLAWSNIKVRYKQSILGIFWAVMQPFAMMLVYSFFLGLLLKVPSDGVPYPLFVFANLTIWGYFSRNISITAVSVSGNAQLINKVYFPRLYLPLAVIIANIVDFLAAFAVLLVMMLYFRARGDAVNLSLSTLGSLVFLLPTIMVSLGIGLWLGATQVKYRDIQQIVPLLLQIWTYATPIVYGASILQDPTVHNLLMLNPMFGVVTGFRAAVLGLPLEIGPIALSVVSGLLILISGLLYFLRFESAFSEVI
jgi:lipopolysaccharide transport system permease protein